MSYLYHMIPTDMKGDTLYPLSELKRKYPSIYNEKMRKYKGRKHQPLEKIPYLNCFWKDVLNFTAVNPKNIKEALIKAGGKPKRIRWYKINPSALDLKNTIVFLYREDLLENGSHNSADNYVKLDIKNIKKFNKIPKSTMEFYKEKYKAKIKPLLFHCIPHILYKGSLNIKNAEVIAV